MTAGPDRPGRKNWFFGPVRSKMPGLSCEPVTSSTFFFADRPNSALFARRQARSGSSSDRSFDGFILFVMFFFVFSSCFFVSFFLLAPLWPYKNMPKYAIETCFKLITPANRTITYCQEFGRQTWDAEGGRANINGQAASNSKQATGSPEVPGVSLVELKLQSQPEQLCTIMETIIISTDFLLVSYEHHMYDPVYNVYVRALFNFRSFFVCQTVLVSLFSTCCDNGTYISLGKNQYL